MPKPGAARPRGTASQLQEGTDITQRSWNARDLSTAIRTGIELTPAELAALQAANSPTANNPYTTEDDIIGVEDTTRTIYIATTGNDTTGNGSIGSPYLTINKALTTIKRILLPDVVVTIFLNSAGTYNMTIDDVALISNFIGAGTLSFEGELSAVIEDGFTVGAAEADDPLTYAVSGGNTGTWVEDEFKHKFIKRNNNDLYFPITQNTTTTISSSCPVAPGTSIKEADTKISFEKRDLDNIIIKLKFLYLELQFPSSPTGNFIDLTCERCYINCDTNTFSSLFKESSIVITQSSTKNMRINSTGSINLTHTFMSIVGKQLLSMNTDAYVFNNTVLENTDAGGTSAAMYITGGTVSVSQATKYIKIVNTPHPIMWTGTVVNLAIDLDELIIKDCTYLFRKASSATDYHTNIQLNIDTIYGTPDTRWFFDNMFEFINSARNRNIQLTGIVYPELENNVKYTWTNNSSGNVVVGDTGQNYHVEVDYVASRGALVEKGVLTVSNKADAVINETNLFDDCGLTFGKNISGTDIQLTYVVDASGNDVNITFINIKRSIVTPLTI